MTIQMLGTMAGYCVIISHNKKDMVNQLPGRSSLLQIVMLCSMFALMLFACQFTRGGGAVTKEALVEIYLQALQRRDEHAILSLIPETQIAQEAVRDKIERFGGDTIRWVWIKYTPLINPRWVRVSLCGVAGKRMDSSPQEICDEIILQKIGERWYLMLGQHRDAVSPPPPLQP